MLAVPGARTVSAGSEERGGLFWVQFQMSLQFLTRFVKRFARFARFGRERCTLRSCRHRTLEPDRVVHIATMKERRSVFERRDLDEEGVTYNWNHKRSSSNRALVICRSSCLTPFSIRSREPSVLPDRDEVTEYTEGAPLLFASPMEPLVRREE